jgi:hypothetical protein
MLRWLGIVAGAALLILVAAVVGARFADGPVGPLPGGPFRSGERVTEPVTDWDFIEDVPQVELQLLDPPRSRTTWVLEEDEQAYIPCGLPGLRLWKQWPHEALEDGRAILRSEGRLYPVELVRVEGPPERIAELEEEMAEKYGLPRRSGYEVWYFKLEPRPAP